MHIAKKRRMRFMNYQNNNIFVFLLMWYQCYIFRCDYLFFKQ